MQIIRLFVDHSLAHNVKVDLDQKQSHYLFNVLRLEDGGVVHLFNGHDGEWRCVVKRTGKFTSCAVSLSCVRQQDRGPDLWLAFAPVKRARIDFISQKATELGVSALVPVVTENTSVTRVNIDRLRNNAIEAAEQCGRVSVPDVRAPVAISDLLDFWPSERRLLVCDETGAGTPIFDALQSLKNSAAPLTWGILTGPEGGFSRTELDLFAKNTIVTRVGLGPRILRADTAIMAALVCWQVVLGDWCDN